MLCGHDDKDKIGVKGCQLRRELLVVSAEPRQARAFTVQRFPAAAAPVAVTYFVDRSKNPSNVA